MNHPLQDILRAHKAGRPLGICSVCSAQRYVLEAAMAQAREDRSLLLIEATSNQVDQFGGYTGMTPADFVRYVRQLAVAQDFPWQQIVLGGDHLGPNVWQGEPAAAAMDKARAQIRAYVLAGFSKIHLDTSMRCADDPGKPHTPLDPRTVAARAAELCAAAEAARAEMAEHTPAPLYVIGTEVPIPGGAQETLEALQPSTVEDTAATIELTGQAFARQGLSDAWERVIALVVQPGVEFGDASVIGYDREKARPLSELIKQYDQLVYEAHSTDYQRPAALRQLVEDHFAILKVGPWLTFAFREAVFALAEIEREWLGGRKHLSLSNIRETLDAAMREHPRYWRQHYRGSASEIEFARKYSYSDRIRYYWPLPEVSRALDLLITNLAAYPAPLTLLSQYLPQQLAVLQEGRIANNPPELIRHKIREVLAVYAAATRASADRLASETV